VRAGEDGTLVVADRSGEQIGRLIAANAVVVSELTPVGQSLEEVFFELTDGAGGAPS
jgi:ABC-2 type transport system ATP-binding protein